ncbi:MAG: Photosystem I reaction center subunit IX [Cyanobacteria bacterium P01_D01_bin.73]
MKDLQRYLSTAPVLAALTATIIAGALIEVNRFAPDMLTTPF